MSEGFEGRFELNEPAGQTRRMYLMELRAMGGSRGSRGSPELPELPGSHDEGQSVRPLLVVRGARVRGAGGERYTFQPVLTLDPNPNPNPNPNTNPDHHH